MSVGWVERSPYWASVVEAFHRYEMCGRLGAGGMAEIFLAREKEPPHRPVVLKRLLPSFAAEDELRAMFVDEARLGMRLTHPSLCRVYDVGRLEGDLVIAMEHVDGVTLADLIDRSPGGLPIPVALSIIADVAGALDSVHRARDEHGTPLGIVHRDVTPRNVMIGFDGRVKLLDFGLAKSALNESVTRPGMGKGKFAYLAPELWREGTPDARADLFALGVCLFEALSGAHLYHRTSPFASKAAIIDEPVPSLLDRLPGAPRALDHVVRRCLAKTPQDRFESSGALHTALTELLEALGMRPDPQAVIALVGERFAREKARGPELEPTRFGSSASSRPPPPKSGPSSFPPPVLRPARERSRAAWALGGAAVAFAGVAIGALLLRGPPAHEPPSFAGAPPSLDAPAADPPSAPEPAPLPPRIAAIPDDAPEEAAEPMLPSRALHPGRRMPSVSYGLLSVSTRPWSEVRFDGRSLGTTPLAEVPVESGRHTLTLLDRDGGEHRASVDVVPGEVTRVVRVFD